MQDDRLMTLRKRLFNLIRAVDKGIHKSYEGALDITIPLPGIFEDYNLPAKIELSCYLLCNGRGEVFIGETLDECVDRFEEWIEGKELEIFGGTRGAV